MGRLSIQTGKAICALLIVFVVNAVFQNEAAHEFYGLQNDALDKVILPLFEKIKDIEILFNYI